MDKYPISATTYRIALTGFGNAVRLNGGACKAVIITAKIAITGLSGGNSTDNAQPVLVGVGAAPSAVTAYVGIPIDVGQTMTFNVADAGMLYVDGANGDAVDVTVLF